MRWSWRVVSTGVLLGGCGGPSLDTADPAELWRLASRAVAVTEQHRFADAENAWRAVLVLAPDWTTARINLGIATLNRSGGEEDARSVFENVLGDDAGSPWAHYCLGLLDARANSPASAQAHFEAVLVMDPGDPDTLDRLGMLHAQAGRPGEAVASFRAALAGNPALLSSLYGLAQALGATGDAGGRDRTMAEFLALRESGGVERGLVYGKMGFYADVIRDFGIEAPPGEPAAAALTVGLRDVSDSAGLGEVTGANGGVTALDVDGDGDTDLVAARTAGGFDAWIWTNDGNGVFTDASADFLPPAEPVPPTTFAVAVADFDGDGGLDLFLGRDGHDLVLGRPEGDPLGRFSRPLAGAGGDKEPTAAVAVGDIDQDGDLDLLLGRRSGLHAYAWTGAGFEAQEPPGPVPGPVTRTLLADTDGDGDLDCVVWGNAPGEPRIRAWTNEKLWRFEETDLPGVTGSGAPFADGVAMGDVDGDGQLDWLTGSRGGPPSLLVAAAGGGYEAARAFSKAAAATRGPGTALVDVDRDGDLDALILGSSPGLFINLDDGSWADGGSDAGLEGMAAAFRGALGHVAFDKDGDGDLDLVVTRGLAPPLMIENTTPTGPDWIGVLPLGVANGGAARGRALGIGTRIEVRSGGTTRVAVSGLGGGVGATAPQTVRFNLAGARSADLRLVWPDGVVQSEFDQPAGRVHRIEQIDREASSCPQLFFWNGERFDYLADFLGGGGVGFLVDPSLYGPPDPEEVVRVGTQLEPLDGAYEIRVGEPMEEATFLDRATLIAVDHPEGTEVWLDERFATGDPVPTGRPLLVEQRIAPTAAEARALDGSGRTRDDLAALQDVDRSTSGPFGLHRRLLGYADPWALELAFPAGGLDGATDAWLFLHGWIEYPYSRLNFAAWQEGRRMESLSLEVPGPEGGWRTVLPEFGYPAGKPRMMAVPLGSILDEARVGETIRLRLRSNLVVRFDLAFLARDVSGGGQLALTEAGPSSAELAWCGFPREVTPDGKLPLLFDYAQRDGFSDFKTHAGDYTAFGPVDRELAERDDVFAVIGAGDEIRLRFDESSFPPVPAATTRTWLLRAQGYCKDMCPLTAFPTTLAPLPFNGMAAYPPPEPLGALHPTWGEQGLTRREPAFRPTR